MNYSNFCIWIGWQEGRFLVQVRPSDQVYGMWEPVEGPLNLEAARALRKDFRQRRLGTVDLKRLGGMLYNGLLPSGVVRDLYQDSRVLAFREGHGLRMRLHIASPELDVLPWELLYGEDEGEFLVLDPRFSIVRTPHVRGAKLPIKKDVPAFPLRIVGAFPSPTDLAPLDTAGEQAAIDSAVKRVDVKREEREVKEALNEMPKDVKVVPTWLPSATLEDLVVNVPEAHIFHFGGHGTTGAYYEELSSASDAVRVSRDLAPAAETTRQGHGTQEPAYLFLEDANHQRYPLPASKLALILRRSLVRVAVFMACDTALQSPSGESLPQFLMESGLSAVVAMQTAVMDNITMKFGRYFYEALAAGLSIDDALSAARYITRVSFDDRYNDWAAPVLYLSPDADGLIFPERTKDPDLEAARQRQPIIYVVQQIGTMTGGQVTGVAELMQEMLERAPDGVRESLTELLKQGPPPSRRQASREEAQTNGATLAEAAARPSATPASDGDALPNLPRKSEPAVGAEAAVPLSPQNYADFELLATDTAVLKIDGSKRIRFTVRVTDSPAGSSIAGITSEYDAKEMRRRLGRWEDRDLVWKHVIELGTWLGSLLMPDEVEDLLIRSLDIVGRDGKGLRLRLTLDGELHNVPWEYLLVNRAGGEATSSDFLALQPNVSVVRHQAAALPPYEIKADRPAQLVVAMASPAGVPALDLDQERRGIEEALASTETIHAIFIEDATRDRLLPEDGGVHLFHFAGHGDVEVQMGTEIRTFEGRGYLVLDDGYGDPALLYADDLALRLRQAGTRVTVLGACRSGRRDDVNVWSSVAAALLKADLGAVVGMQYAVQDSSAVAFARQLYQALAAGLPIDTAVTNGRLAMAYADDVRGWGVPVLYLRAPDGVVFPEYTADPSLDQARQQLRVTASQRIRELRGRAVAVAIGEMKQGEVLAEQEIDLVASGAEATAVEIDKASGGSVEARQKADVVEEDATLTGVKAKRLQ